MKNIFLAPRSNETSYKNFESTILKGRDYSFFEPYLTAPEKEVLSKQNPVIVWGNKESLRARWNKMEPGDYVLFYKDGGFYYSAEVVLKKFSPELGKKLWPADKKNGKIWPCLFFVQNLQEVNIPIRVIQELAEYEPGWDRVQGFMALRASGLAAIENKFGSVEAFLSQEPKMYQVLERVLEATKEEHLDEEPYKILDKTQLLRDAASYTYAGASHKTEVSPRKVRIENQTQKKRIAALEDYSCQLCGWTLEWTNPKGKKRYRIDVDHIVDKAKKGTEDAQNLWVLCPNCHAMKTVGRVSVNLRTKKVFRDGKEVKLHHNFHLKW